MLQLVITKKVICVSTSIPQAHDTHLFHILNIYMSVCICIYMLSVTHKDYLDHENLHGHRMTIPIYMYIVTVIISMNAYVYIRKVTQINNS